MKEVHDFETENDEPRFDVKYVNKNANEKTIWGDPELLFPDSSIRELANNTYDYLYGGYEIWIKDPQLENGKPSISEEFIPYIMALTVDNMREDEIPLSFRFVNGCFVVGQDDTAKFRECKEFYEKFYHLILGVNYAGSDADLIPSDEEESEKYIAKKFDEFNSKMKKMLGDRYLPGNSEE